MAKKLSIEEILKAARAQSGKGTGDSDQSATPVVPKPATETPTAEATPVETPPIAEAPAAPVFESQKPEAPKSTKDILAAARSQTGGGAAAKPVAPGGAPKSTKDILAAARGQTGAGQTGGGQAGGGAGGAKSTSDILAAARNQAGGGAKAAGSAASSEGPPTKAAVAKPVATKVAPTKPAGERPSVEEMLRAAREGKPVGETALAKPAKPPLVIPQRPSAVAKPAIVVSSEPRRSFLSKMGFGLGAGLWVFFGTPFRVAWTTFTGAMGLWTLDFARFMMPNVLVEPPSKFKVGPPSDYPPAAVSTKWTAQYGVWLVHNDYKGKDIIYALQTVCTHLGCTPNWLEGERKFKCPCHGSGFYITGVNFEGPAPRPLERMAIRISEDGALEVDKSRKFQEELGQWQDPASFVEMA
jgi:cytochrome b6-f complex iron-sulfur subunit